MQYIARTGGSIKYGHSEVGNFTLDGKIYEQNEIEFLPVDARRAADQLMIAKWVIRNLGYIKGYDITFAPKITVGKAGSGLHIHMRIMRDGRNMMLDSDRRLSNEARRGIAGIMDLAQAITAFGNTVPTSYFRLVPKQEAPTNVCWGDRNRSVLVRVPWVGRRRKICVPSSIPAATGWPTWTPRKTDGRDPFGRRVGGYLSADSVFGCGHASWLRMPDAMKVAEDTYVDVNIHRSKMPPCFRA